MSGYCPFHDAGGQDYSNCVYFAECNSKSGSDVLICMGNGDALCSPEITGQLRENTLELFKLSKVLDILLSCGGCPETGYGWETCDFCHGHPNHKEDCQLVNFKLLLDSSKELLKELV